VLFGIGFILGGVMEFMVAALAPGWKWVYILLGIVSSSGIIMIALGFWAISPDDRTVATYRGIVLLVVWVGFAALFRASRTSSSASGSAPPTNGSRPPPPRVRLPEAAGDDPRWRPLNPRERSRARGQRRLASDMLRGASALTAAGKGPRRRSSYRCLSVAARPQERTMTTTLIDECNIAAYRSWLDRRVTPAYVRGIPSWVWQSALRCRQRQQNAVAI